MGGGAPGRWGSSLRSNLCAQSLSEQPVTFPILPEAPFSSLPFPSHSSAPGVLGYSLISWATALFLPSLAVLISEPVLLMRADPGPLIPGTSLMERRGVGAVAMGQCGREGAGSMVDRPPHPAPAQKDEVKWRAGDL